MGTSQIYFKSFSDWVNWIALMKSHKTVTTNIIPSTAVNHEILFVPQQAGQGQISTMIRITFASILVGKKDHLSLSLGTANKNGQSGIVLQYPDGSETQDISDLLIESVAIYDLDGNLSKPVYDGKELTGAILTDVLSNNAIKIQLPVSSKTELAQYTVVLKVTANTSDWPVGATGQSVVSCTLKKE